MARSEQSAGVQFERNTWPQEYINDAHLCSFNAGAIAGIDAKSGRGGPGGCVIEFFSEQGLAGQRIAEPLPTLN